MAKNAASPPTPVTASKAGWLEKPLNIAVGVLTIATAIFGIGYTVATNKTDVEQKLATLQQQQDCNKRVAEEQEKCAEYRRTVEAEKMQNLAKAVENLQEAGRKKP